MRKIMNANELRETNKTIVYIDKYGILHASKLAAHVKEETNGKVMVTDEVTAEGGYVYFNGRKAIIYGAGEGYVYLTKAARDEDCRYLVGKDAYAVPGTSVTVHRKKLDKDEITVIKKAYELYMAIK